MESEVKKNKECIPLQLPVAAPDNRAVFYDLMGDQTYLAGRHGQRRYSKLRPERRLADTRYARQIGMCNSIEHSGTHWSYTVTVSSDN